LPYEPVGEEHFNEARHVEDPIHEEGPHEDKISMLFPPFNEYEVTQASISPSHEENKLIKKNRTKIKEKSKKCTFNGYDVNDFG
jgi:hypothetical protein